MMKGDLNIAIRNAEDKPSKTSTAGQVWQKVGASRLLCATEEESTEIQK